MGNRPQPRSGRTSTLAIALAHPERSPSARPIGRAHGSSSVGSRARARRRIPLIRERLGGGKRVPKRQRPGDRCGAGETPHKRWRYTRHTASRKRSVRSGRWALSMTPLSSRSRKQRAAPRLTSQKSASSTSDPSCTVQKDASSQKQAEDRPRQGRTRRGRSPPARRQARLPHRRSVDSLSRLPNRLGYSPPSVVAPPGVTSAPWRPAFCRCLLMADLRVLNPSVALRVRLPMTSLPSSSMKAP